jgi:type IV pilus assembly protein PilZ
MDGWIGHEYGKSRESLNIVTAPNTNAPLQGILSLAIKDRGALYNAYMPFVRGGGLFVPTIKHYVLGDEVFILLTLMEDNDRLPIAGKVVWITPAGAQGNRVAGIGVQFNESSESEAARTKIEAALAGTLNLERPTHTM